MSSIPPKKQDTLFVSSFEKGLRVMAAFSEDHVDLSLSDLVERTGLDKSAVQRFANTLHVTGFLSKDPETRRFSPTIRYLELGSAYLWADPLIPLVTPKLIALSRSLGERINCARLVGQDVVYVVRVPTQHTTYAATIPGRRFPALNTACGRTMIASLPAAERARIVQTWPIVRHTPRTLLDRTVLGEELEQAAVDGYAVSVNQNILNEIAMAAPILDKSGYPVAAVQCSSTILKTSVEEMRQTIAPRLVEVANSIQPPRQDYPE